MSVFIGLWKLLGWLKGGGSTPEEHRGLRIAALCNLGIILALIAVTTWQRVTINALRAWQSSVLEAVSSAADLRDGKGHLRLVKSGEILAHINALGRFRTDTIAAQAKARADDAAHVLTTARQDAAINRKSAHDYDARLAAARAEADALRARLRDRRDPAAAAPVGMRYGATAPGAGESGGRSAPLPGLSGAGPTADAAAEANGLSQSGASCPEPMTIDERQLATEQAIQLDELITTIENFAKVKR